MSNEINKVRTNNILYDIRDTSKQDLLIPGNNITIENNVISATTEPYVLPMAGSNILGGVKIGENIGIDNTGRISSGLSSLPDPTVELVGKIVQYIGENTSTLRKGYFYKCVNNNGTLSWEATYTQTPTFVTGPLNTYTNENPLDLDLLEPGAYTIPIATTYNTSFSPRLKATIEGVSIAGNITGVNSFELPNYGLTLQVIRATKDVTKQNPDIAYFKRTVYDSDGTIRIYPMKISVIYIGNAPYMLQGAPSGFTDLLKTVTVGNAQTITGKKTFTVLPESSATPTTNNQLANKKYVDDTVKAESNIDIADAISDGLSNPFIFSGKKEGVYTPKKHSSRWTFKKDESSGSIQMDNLYPILITIEKTIESIGTPLENTDFASVLTMDSGGGVSYHKFYIDTNGNMQRRVVYIGTTSSYNQPNFIVDNLAQTFYGVKTFASLPVSSNTPTNDNQLVNKKYVDSHALDLLGLQEYSNTATYNIGDFIYHDSLIYKCIVAINPPENWNTSHWTEITYMSYLNEILIGNALGGSY